MYLHSYFLLASVTKKLNPEKKNRTDYEFFFMSMIHTKTDDSRFKF